MTQRCSKVAFDAIHYAIRNVRQNRPATAAQSHRNATSRSNGRRENEAYRVREHLTEAEMDKLLAALRRNRHGHRVGLVGLIIYSHGLRVFRGLRSSSCN